MNDTDRPPTPHPDYEELRVMLGDHAAGLAAVDELHAALHAAEPQPAHIAASAGRAREIPVIAARIANWWDAPRTQNWLSILADAGL